MQDRSPVTSIALAKRDIAPAFRLLRFHTALRLAVMTKHTGRFFDLGREGLSSIYPSTPFGRSGSPSHFSVFGDALALTRRPTRNVQSRLEWSRTLFSSFVCGCWFLIEAVRKKRMGACALLWESIAHGLLGVMTINQGKLDEEGFGSKDT